MEEKKNYGATLNLPKTDFPMRGNLPENEPKIKEEVLEKAWETKQFLSQERYMSEFSKICWNQKGVEKSASMGIYIFRLDTPLLLQE